MKQKPADSKTRIIATIGPASSPKDVLKEMIMAGVDVCRLNFSHGSHEDHLKSINTIKELREELGINVAILADLQGPKLRIGNVENNGVELVDGSFIEFINEDCLGNAQRVYMSYKEFPMDVNAGDFILIDDGKLKLEVVETNKRDKVKAKVVHGGILSSKKGVNLPNTKISLPSLTEKDLRDVNFVLDYDIDWIALSFVRSVTDIVELKEIIKRKKKNALVVAKIEKPEAIPDIKNIIDMTDAIMVARGDLGVEVAFDHIPILQKRIVEQCIKMSKPVIIATQMMESMIQNFRPTRAEANDVGNAVLDGADTLMLSGETSVGKYPVEVIKSMHSIIQYTEENGYNYYRGEAPTEFDRTFLSDSICYNACQLAKQSNAKAIVVFTNSGNTAFKISGYRPKADIYVFTWNKDILPRMSLLWGVKAFYCEHLENFEKAIEHSIQTLKSEHLIHHDDLIVHVASTPVQMKGRANTLKLSFI